MSETTEPTEPVPQEAQILDLTDNEDGTSTFRISKTTSSRDVLATLEYAQPSPDAVNKYLDRMLEHYVGLGVLNGKHVKVSDPTDDPSGAPVTPQAKIERTIVFGDEPSIEDVRTIFTSVYGEEKAAPKMRRLLLTAIDLKILPEASVKMDVNNEMIAAKDDDIAAEMAKLTDEFYGFEEPTIE